MTPQWVVRMPSQNAASLGRLRNLFGIEAASDGEVTWLRGVEADDALGRALQTLPLAERFDVLSDGRLRPVGALVPTARLPRLSWRPLAELLRPQKPVPALSGRLASKVKIQLVRSAMEAVPNLLLASVESLAAFANGAPESRFRCCRLAVRDDGRALIHGRPLPSIPGDFFVESHGVAIPAGYDWSPRVSSQVIAESLRLAPGELALFDKDARVVRILAERFVQMTRSSIRQSREALSGV